MNPIALAMDYPARLRAGSKPKQIQWLDYLPHLPLRTLQLTQLQNSIPLQLLLLKLRPSLYVQRPVVRGNLGRQYRKD